MDLVLATVVLGICETSHAQSIIPGREKRPNALYYYIVGLRAARKWNALSSSIGRQCNAQDFFSTRDISSITGYVV